MKLFGNSRGRLDPDENDQDLLEDWPEEDDLSDDGDDDGEFEGYYDEDDYYDEEFDGDEAYDDEDWEEPGGIRGVFQRMSSTKVGLLAAALTLLVMLGAVALVINYFLSLINYQSADSEYFPTVQAEELLPEESPVSSLVAQLEEEDTKDLLEATPEELAQWDEHIEDVVSDSDTYEIPIDQDVYNILLIGSDTRESGEVGRSDAMILVSINQKSKAIYLTSFLRDCYVHIPGYGNTRLNHAFAYGGPDLLEQTLEENFKVHVDKYVAVDFFSFMDVVDTLDGIWLYVSEEEQEVTNDYIWSMNKLMGLEWSTDYIWNAGWQKLNGKQTLCYARNRYVGNDYERTQRQRNVISQVIAGAKNSSPATLVSLAQVVLPQVTTDMEKTQVLNYAANIGAYMNYEVVSQQIPAAGTYYGATIGGMSVISVDLDANISYLQGTIYSGESTQTADDFGAQDEEWDMEFWGREEWKDVQWDQVDFSKVDWYTIDYDTVDWTDYYYDAAETSPAPSASAKPSSGQSGYGTSGTATPKPSPSPKISTGTVSPPSPSPSGELNETDENG